MVIGGGDGRKKGGVRWWSGWWWWWGLWSQVEERKHTSEGGLRTRRMRAVWRRGDGEGRAWDGTWVAPAVAHTANARGDEAHIGRRAAGAADGGGAEMRW